MNELTINKITITLIQEALIARDLLAKGGDDGIDGPDTRAAYEKAAVLIAPPPAKPVTVHQVLASSFADHADIVGFKRAKAKGMTDLQAFKYGDNGIGKWGDDTTIDKPMCALPPEDWEHLKTPRGARVKVVANGKTVICELRDTMPRKKNVKNSAGIDLNPGAQKAIGLNPPFMVPATWQFV